MIAGNTLAHVSISTDGTNNNVVEGNYIGTNAAGSAKFNVGGIGMELFNDIAGTQIGGTAAGAANLISGNNSANIAMAAANGIVIQGNVIGLNAAGTASLGQNNDFVIDNASHNLTIGGTTAGAGNVISAHNIGIDINSSGGAVHDVLIAGNLIGTNPAGTAAIPNGTGISITGSAGHITIGGTTAGTATSLAATPETGSRSQGA